MLAIMIQRRGLMMEALLCQYCKEGTVWDEALGGCIVANPMGYFLGRLRPAQ